MKKEHAFLLKSFVLLLSIAVGGFVLIRSKLLPSVENAGVANEQKQSSQESFAAALPKQEVQPINVTAGSEQKRIESVTSESRYAEQLQERYQALNTNENYPSIDSRMKEIKARRPDQSLTAEQLLDVMEKPKIWDSIDEPEKLPDFAKNLKFPNPKFISFHRAKVESLLMGDEITLPVEDNRETYKMIVDEIKSHADGNITWRGYIDFEGDRHYASLTQNDNGLTVGGFTTPNGHFTVEAQGDIGWVAESQSAFHDVSDATDYVIP